MLDDVTTHIEFAGYETGATESGKAMRATSSAKPNFLYKEFRGGVLFTSFWGAQPDVAARRLDYLGWINRLSEKAAVARYYADKDDDLVIEAFYPGPYNRTVFGSFLDLWEAEHAGALFADEDTGSFLS